MLERPSEKKMFELLNVPEGIRSVMNEMEEDRKDYADFEDSYSAEDIQVDKTKAESIQQGFKEKESKLGKPEQEYLQYMKQKAEIFEAFIYSQASRAEWFGKNSSLIVTKEHDDLINGVDLVLEHEEGEQKKHVGLALDVTFNATVAGISKKIERIENEVRGGNLSEVKYFETDDGVGLNNVPRLVIGVQQERVGGLLGLWAGQEGVDSESRDLNSRLMKKHYAQIVILLQMKHQLGAFEKLARAYSKDDTAEKLSEANNFVHQLLDEKQEIYKIHKEKIEDDPVLQIVKKYTKELEARILEK